MQTDTSALLILAKERLREDDLDNAAALFHAVLAREPECFDALLEMSVLAGRRGASAAAAELARCAAAVRPDSAEALCGYALNVWRLHRRREALDLMTQSLALREMSCSHYDMALILDSLGDCSEALVHMRRALELAAVEGVDTRHMRSDLSFMVLRSGRLHEGLVLNESRWADNLVPKSDAWCLGVPMWEGEDLRGRCVLVHSEQGLGDTIQWARFIPKLKSVYGAGRVVLLTHRALARLMTDQCGIDQVVVTSGELLSEARAVHYHVPIVSLVRVIGEEYSGQPRYSEPYLRAVMSPTARRAPVSVPEGTLAVGLVYSASTGHANWATEARARERSVPVGDLLRLGSVPGVRLFSLQYGPHAADLAGSGADYLVTDLAPYITDMADTAALASCMDLVVSVDTGPMHAAAAVGVSTLMLNPVVPCWRWCCGTHIWYGCLDALDQVESGNWDWTIEQARFVVEEMADQKRRRAA